MNTIEIICQNCDERREFPKGITLAEVSRQFNVKLKYPILGALVNNKLRELSFDLYKPKTVNFIDFSHNIGYRMYVRSVYFLLYAAVKEVIPQALLRIDHSVSKGWYAELEGENIELNEDLLKRIRERMVEMVAADLPFTRQEILTAEAAQLFMKNGQMDKAELFGRRHEMYTSVYGLNGFINYFYGYLVPSTGYLTLYDIRHYYKGLLIRVPDPENFEIPPAVTHQPKLFKVFREHKKWINILDVPFVGNLNKATSEKRDTDLIKISEALHEKRIARIADKIYRWYDKVKIVLISGPSSSGKTTFSKRLSIQLMVLGLKPVQISIDNYFVDREHTPRDEKGEYDFESLQAIDIDLFNENLNDLLIGREVRLPRFDFNSGRRSYYNGTFKMKPDQVLIIEGIHGLNPDLTPHIDPARKFGIFVSALTQISIDAQNPISSTDNRLFRRMVRDYRFRGYSALETLRRWDSVRNGEEKNIFPFQENADVMFNSALLYELAVLKTYAEPLLKTIPEIEPEHAEALRLMKFLSYFQPISSREIPPTSILREFLGGSSFIY
ncbi:MAG: Uridine kinase [Bacteroidetes bacterium ADurb.Bin012]|jgi:uridine kinase|nr:MAG: Uridine kinase [Bacteroidetes bacterium ADurb.Bin012]